MLHYVILFWGRNVRIQTLYRAWVFSVRPFNARRLCGFSGIRRWKRVLAIMLSIVESDAAEELPAELCKKYAYWYFPMMSLGRVNNAFQLWTKVNYR